MMWRLIFSAGLLALASCGDFPRDPEKTLEKVRAEKSFKVGLAQGGEALDPSAQLLIGRIGAATGAQPEVERGDAEPLLTRLESGQIDLVIGRFSAVTPWSQLVSFSPPLRIEARDGAELHLVAAMRNGENAWISLIEREARELGAGVK